MSLELEIQKLTDAVQELTGAIETLMQRPVAEPVKTFKTGSVDAPVNVVAEAAPVMPAAPTFEPVIEAAPAGGAPFTDGKGLIDYVMTIYKELGPEKGAKIQGVLTEMGLQNVNELRPTEYDAFYAKVEALK